jgi:hypothetical protein
MNRRTYIICIFPPGFLISGGQEGVSGLGEIERERLFPALVPTCTLPDWGNDGIGPDTTVGTGRRYRGSSMGWSGLKHRMSRHIIPQDAINLIIHRCWGPGACGAGSMPRPSNSSCSHHNSWPSGTSFRKIKSVIRIILIE